MINRSESWACFRSGIGPYDIDDTTSPLEAGLGWITKFTKDFTNKSFFEQQKSEGVTKKLVGFEMIDRGIPRHHYSIQDAQGNTIGHVCSGTQSPSLQKAIGMACSNKTSKSSLLLSLAMHHQL